MDLPKNKFLLNQGFSLIEILVALAILAVIGVIAIPNFRQFNSDQEINNTTSNILRLLQQAQTSAQTQTACVNTQPLTSNNPANFWDLVVFSNAGITSYKLQAECINGATGLNPSTSVFETDSLTNVTLTVKYKKSAGTYVCAFPAEIKFYTISASQNGSPPPVGTAIQLVCNGNIIPEVLQVILNISQTGFPVRYVTVEANGTVHQ